MWGAEAVHRVILVWCARQHVLNGRWVGDLGGAALDVHLLDVSGAVLVRRVPQGIQELFKAGVRALAQVVQHAANLFHSIAPRLEIHSACLNNGMMSTTFRLPAWKYTVHDLTMV